MKLSVLQAALGSAIVLLSAPACQASDAHRRAHDHLHQLERSVHTHPSHHVRGRHTHPNSLLGKRGKCQLPTDDDNIVAITPGEMNAGWAMSPDQECLTDQYCPYACKPGMVMAQWDPDSTYDYPASMVSCTKSGIA